MKQGLTIAFSVFALIAISCTKESVKLEVTPSEVSLYVEGTKQITTNVEDAQFSSKDEFYASVDNTGLVTGNKVGETEILVNSTHGTATIPVTIIPQYTLYPDLDGLVGKSQSDITKVMGNSYQTSTSSDGNTMMTYLNPTKYAEAIGFTISKSNNLCSSIVVAVPTSYTSMLTKHLIERYSIAGMQNDYYFFLNHDKKVMIGLTVYSASLLAVAYMNYTSTKSSDIPDYSFIDDFRAIIR
ncbi:MAG: Ig-like domain-containing protein [Bacteroidales bacterium]|nr:Ig-like domain-containing protein [Bacteroidales bacterium]